LDATEIRQSVWYLLYHIVIPFFIHHSYRSKYTEKRMNVTRLMPLIYPFIRYFVQKRLSGGKLLSAEKLQLQPRLHRKLRAY
jgi:hypothetical protein